MTIATPHVYGPVTVTWKAEGSVDAITYSNEPLAKVVTDRSQVQIVPSGAILSTELHRLIDDLLNTLASLPAGEKKQKISLADRI